MNVSFLKPDPPPADDATTPVATADSAAGTDSAGGSALLASFNVAKDAFSVSSLSLPFAMASAGFGTSLCLLLAIGLGSMYTGVLIVQASKDAAQLPQLKGKRVTSYMDLGRITFGVSGEVVVFVVSVLTCLGAAAGWFIAIGECLHSAISAVSYGGWIGISLAVVLPLNYLRHVHHLGYASVLACFTYLSLLLLVASHGIADRVHHNTPDVPLAFLPPPSPTGASGGPAFLLSFGIIKFCFAGHEVFLTIEQNLARPNEYNRVIGFAFTGMIAINIAMSVCGYAVFGTQTAANILFNLDNSGVGLAARVLVGVMLVVTVPIVLLAAFEMVEDVLWARVVVPYRIRNQSKQQPLSTAASASTSTARSNDVLIDSSDSLIDSSNPHHGVSAVGRGLDSVHSLNDPAADSEPSPLLRKHLPAATSDAAAAASAAEDTPIPAKDFSLLSRIAIRTPLTLLSVGVAIGVPAFARVVGLVGAVGDSTIGLILPVCFYISVHYQLKRHRPLIPLSDTESPALAAHAESAAAGAVTNSRLVMAINVFVLLLGGLGMASGVGILLWS